MIFLCFSAIKMWNKTKPIRYSNAHSNYFAMQLIRRSLFYNPNCCRFLFCFADVLVSTCTWKENERYFRLNIFRFGCVLAANPVLYAIREIDSLGNLFNSAMIRQELRNKLITKCKRMSSSSQDTELLAYRHTITHLCRVLFSGV